MTKEILMQLLKEYNENSSKLELRKRERRMIELRLKGSKEAETKITNSYGINNDIRSKNTVSDKVLNEVTKRETRREEDEERLEELDQIISELENKVEEVNIRLKRTKL